MPSIHPQPQPLAFPVPCPGLEEVGAGAPGDWGQALAFALHRALGVGEEARPVLFAASRAWINERGGLSARGLAHLGIAPCRLLQVRADRPIEALWALEEALKSGAVAGAVGAADAVDFVAGRRLDFAARAGGAMAVVLRPRAGEDLSAARLRWHICAEASPADPYDPYAPGRARLSATLTRRRSGPLGAWTLEHDDETHRLRLAAGLADHGLVAGSRTHAAA